MRCSSHELRREINRSDRPKEETRTVFSRRLRGYMGEDDADEALRLALNQKALCLMMMTADRRAVGKRRTQ